MSGDGALADLVAAAQDLLADPDLRTYLLAYGALFFALEVLAKAMPLYFESLELSLALLGGAYAASNLLEIGLSPLAGLLADRVDRAAIGAVAAAVMASLVALVGVVRAALPLAALVVALSSLEVLFNNALTPAVDAAAEEDRAGLAWGVYGAALSIGGGLGLLVGSVATAATDAVATAFVAVVPVLLVVAVGLAWRSDPSLEGIPSAASARAALREASPVAAFRELSAWGVLAKFCAIEAATTMAAGMSLFLVPALATRSGFDAAGALLALAGSHAVAIPANLAGGAVVDRRDTKRMYVAHFLVQALALAAFAVATRPSTFLLAIAVLAVGTAFDPAVTTFFFSHFDEEEAARAWGVEGAVAKAVGVVAPAAGGLLFTVDPRAVFAIGAALSGVAVAVALTVPRQSPT